MQAFQHTEHQYIAWLPSWLPVRPLYPSIHDAASAPLSLFSVEARLLALVASVPLSDPQARRGDSAYLDLADLEVLWDALLAVHPQLPGQPAGDNGALRQPDAHIAYAVVLAGDQDRGFLVFG